MRGMAFFALCALFAQGASSWAMPASGELPARSEIPSEFKWRLSDIYETDEAWAAAHDAVRARLPEIAARAGTLGKSAKDLLSALRMSEEIEIELGKVYVYANMKSHEDTAEPKYQAMASKAGTLATEASAAMSFITPEILSIPPATLDGFIDPAKGHDFDDYRFMISELRRSQEHVLSPAEEAILARAGDMAGAAENAFSMLTNADMKFPTIKDDEGRDTELTEERYIKFISSRKRDVRRAAYEALYETYKKNNNTLGATFDGMLKAARFYAETRRYASDLEAALHGPDIPREVYDRLVDTVEGSLAPLHRYMALRKRVLGLDELRMYDIYCPLVENPYKDIPWERAKEIATEALAPLGGAYMETFREGLSSGWIDVYSNRGKRGGAYSWGSYGTHPYILLNYNGELNDVETLVHEMGHSLHSYYSRKTQPPATADYRTFCAEVASTTNEELLLTHLLKTTADREKRIYLLCTRLDRVRATVYRQTMFASFERAVHDMHQRGEDTTAAALGKLWHEMNERYYGPDMAVDELIDYEWSRIPHFYTPFYVYQYATGYSAAASLARGILERGEAAREPYLNFLKSGGSDRPINLLKAAGVDMSTPAPVEDVIRMFEETLAELEALLGEAK